MNPVAAPRAGCHAIRASCQKCRPTQQDEAGSLPVCQLVPPFVTDRSVPTSGRGVYRGYGGT